MPIWLENLMLFGIGLGILVIAALFAAAISFIFNLNGEHEAYLERKENKDDNRGI